MSTALSHHHNRIPVVAAGAAVLAVAATGIILGVTRDDADTHTVAPGDKTTSQSFQLEGSSHQKGNWDHAGTNSGGRIQLGL